MALFGKKEAAAPADLNLPPTGMQPDPVGTSQMPPDMQMSDPNAQQGYPQAPPQDYYNQQGVPPPPGGVPDPSAMAMPDPMGAPDPNQMPDMGMGGGGMPPPDMGMMPSPDSGFNPSQPFTSDDSRERIEEVAEAIIDEKWNELIKDINKIIEWREHVDTQINSIAQEIINLKERFESLHKGVLGKISEYDTNLTNVGSEIKAMEKVFQDILPNFTDNINRLERVAKGFGTEPATSTSPRARRP